MIQHFHRNENRAPMGLIRTSVARCLRGCAPVSPVRGPRLPECERAIVSLDRRNRTKTKHNWLFDPDACLRTDRPLVPKRVVGSKNFWWRDLFQLLLVEAFVFFCAFFLSKLFGW